ncbi:MAG TPA: hypothetical protein VFN56_00935, partial [Candidatus Saccharimonadales bacterium]|nr:hypothetical protein [Candidatus Saccharimonadales bacterium]
IVIEQSKQVKLEKLFDALKVKYWGTSDIVLHSEDIGKNINDCSIFKNNSGLKSNFIDDLMKSLHKAPVICFHAVVDKSKLASSWQETTVVRKTAQAVFFDFLAYLFTRPPDSRGKIIIEASSPFKDSEYLKAFTYFLSPGCKLIDTHFPSYEEIKKTLTQISFVTKLNHDTETQIADILAFGASCKQQQNNGASFSPNSYKGKICQLIDEKQVSVPIDASAKDKRFYAKIESFKLIK